MTPDERAMEIHDIEVQLGLERIYAKNAVRPDIRRQAVGNVARLEARLAELRTSAPTTPAHGIAHDRPTFEPAAGATKGDS